MHIEATVVFCAVDSTATIGNSSAQAFFSKPAGGAVNWWPRVDTDGTKKWVMII